MTNVLITTVRRHTPYTEPSGFIYVYHLDRKIVRRRCVMAEPAFRDIDTNPRGGIRGSRGISVRDDQIAIANASMIFRYDPKWNLLGTITHPSFNAIHDIMYQEDTLWATSARNDLLCNLDFDGNIINHHYMREPSPAIKELGWQPAILLDDKQIVDGTMDFRDPTSHVEEVYDRAHINSICSLPDGGLIVSLGLVLDTKFANLLRIKSSLVKAGVWPVLLAANRNVRQLLGLSKNMHSDLVIQPAKAWSAVLRISPDGAHTLILALDGSTVPAHSLMPLQDGTAVYLNTTQGAVVHFNYHNGEILSSNIVTEGFLRGVTRLENGQLLMGSKGELILYDLSNHTVVDRLRLTDDLNESVYDIKILPSHYHLPPESFEQHFFETYGFRADEAQRLERPIENAESR